MDNIQAIKSHLGEYIAEVGATPSKAGGKDMYTCPLCGSGVGGADGKKHTGAFHYEKNNQVWKCHSCGRGGTIIDLYGYMNSIDPKTKDGKKAIIQALEDKYNIEDTSSFNVVSAKEDFKDIPTPEEQAERDYIEEEINLCIGACEHTVGFSDYLTNRGISLEVQRRFNIGYFGEWLHPKTKYRHFGKIKREWLTPRIIIPTSDRSYLARATTPEPPENDPRHKYYVKAYKVGEVNIFNSNALTSSDYCFIVEGEIDALSCIECGYNAIGLGSVTMIEKLFNNYEINKDIVLLLALDNDKAGQDSLQKLISQANAHRNYYIPVDSNFLFDGAKDCNEALQKDKKALIEHLEHYKQKALDLDKSTFFESLEGFQGIGNNTTVAHHNDNGNNSTSSNAPELPPIPEITPENITSSDVLSYMLSLHTEIDILNYIQLLKDKARECKKLKDVEALCNAYKKEAFKRLEEQERAGKKSTLPEWVLIDRHGNTNVDEPQYIKSIINVIGIKTINGKMLTPNGEMQNGKISSIIQNDIEPYVKSNLAVKTKNIVLAIKNKSYCEKLPEDTQNIHFTNGTYNITSRVFENKKMWCVNRLAVKYNKNAEKPIRWLNFLEELLLPTDILTIQEMCGYFLIPETRLQTMTFLIGDGGEGKSIIGRVLTALFGLDNVYTDKLHELQDSRFKLANCENKLLFIDDDMKMGALAETDIIKTFANGGNMSVERKGTQSYLANIYTRALCFGNGTLSSLYDHTHGFYRRQLTIRVKPKDKNRQNNLFLDKQIIDNELEGVLLWCLEGLHRLIDSEFKLTISPEAQKELEDAERKANPLIEFLESDLVEFSPNYNATTREIFDAYNHWVYIQGDNDKRLTQPDKITKILKSMAENNSLPIRYDKNLKRDYSKSALRGFKGIHIKTTNGNYIDKNTYTPC